uniref:Uncharacterized protein n=1 Tax=Megaselia scalaris TaxID=36166 RepID=T1H0F8_MEGSC
MCIQQVSIEATSRRNSVDSQVSVKLTQTKVARQRRSKNSKHRGGRGLFNKVRRESSTSVESYLIYFSNPVTLSRPVACLVEVPKTPGL